MERWANILEFRKVLGESSAVPLGTFLEEISLLSDVDNLQAEDQAATTLLGSPQGVRVSGGLFDWVE